MAVCVELPIVRMPANFRIPDPLLRDHMSKAELVVDLDRRQDDLLLMHEAVKEDVISVAEPMLAVGLAHVGTSEPRLVNTELIPHPIPENVGMLIPVGCVLLVQEFDCTRGYNNVATILPDSEGRAYLSVSDGLLERLQHLQPRAFGADRFAVLSELEWTVSLDHILPDRFHQDG